MALIRVDGAANFTSTLRLFTVCSKGIVAEWDPASHELLGRNQLDLQEGGKVRLAAIN